MSTPLTMGFNVFSTDPLDKQRTNFNTYAHLLAMPLTWRYPFMRCNVLTGVEKGTYCLKGTVNVNAVSNDNWVKEESPTVSVVNDRGNWDASSGSFPNEGGSGVDGEIMKGDFWYVSVPGVAHGIEFNIGDSVRSRIDAPGDSITDWAGLEGNLGYVPENKALRRTTLVGADDFSYPTTKAVKDADDLKANDDAVVKLTGNQSIAGNKDFTGQVSFRYKRVADITGNITLNASHVNAMVYVTAAAIITVPDNILSEGAQIKFIRDTAGEVEFVAGGATDLRSAGNRKRIAEQNGAAELIAKSASVVHLFGALKI